MTPPNPRDMLSQQRIFVMEMRARRETAGLSRNKLAAALGCTPQWLAKVESYHKQPSEGLAEDLDTFYKTGGTFHRIWQELAEARRMGLLSQGFVSLIEAEKKMTENSYFEPLLIPGLFQTEEYMRLCFSTGLRRDKLEELVTIRLGRQTVLEKADPPWLFLLMREAVIRDLPPEIRAGQCERLLELMERPRIAIQVVPTSAPVFVQSAFHVISFEKAEDIVYVDASGLGTGHIITDPEIVRNHTLMFNLIRTNALSAEESANTIRTTMEGI